MTQFYFRNWFHFIASNTSYNSNTKQEYKHTYTWWKRSNLDIILSIHTMQETLSFFCKEVVDLRFDIMKNYSNWLIFCTWRPDCLLCVLFSDDTILDPHFTLIFSLKSQVCIVASAADGFLLLICQIAGNLLKHYWEILFV
jgi:hypothetical protein